MLKNGICMKNIVSFHVSNDEKVEDKFKILSSKNTFARDLLQGAQKSISTSVVRKIDPVNDTNAPTSSSCNFMKSLGLCFDEVGEQNVRIYVDSVAQSGELCSLLSSVKFLYQTPLNAVESHWLAYLNNYLTPVNDVFTIDNMESFLTSSSHWQKTITSLLTSESEVRDNTVIVIHGKPMGSGTECAVFDKLSDGRIRNTIVLTDISCATSNGEAFKLATNLGMVALNKISRHEYKTLKEASSSFDVSLFDNFVKSMQSMGYKVEASDFDRLM